MEAKIREAAVAGKFYPNDKNSLLSLMDKLLTAESDKIDHTLALHGIIGGIVPHAGMIFSGYQAVHFYELVKLSQQVFDTVVVVNPNHTGRGTGLFNTSTYQYWETPLGKLEADASFLDNLGIEPNNLAHITEHSGEVQLPFMQHFFPFPFRLVMITMNVQTVESSYILAQKVFDATQKTGNKTLFIASSDFNHYESPEKGFQKDQYVIDKILSYDIEGIYQAVKEHHVTACGFGPVMTLMYYSKLISLNVRPVILCRGHSGNVYPSKEVVDYVSFALTNVK